MAKGLTDMEELLGRVSSPNMADFLREALACYGAGAHRACIVMTFITVFEDLRAKTKALASVSSHARAVSTAIEGLANGQKPFETQLVDQLQSKDLITALQARRLKQIIDHRNKAAHPSGHHASAEEARFVFFEAVDKFLAQPVLSTTHAVDRVLAQLVDSNYFPDNNMANMRGIVSDELKSIHVAAYPYLVSRLVELLGGSDATVARNARYFLTGLSGLRNDEARPVLLGNYIKPKCTDPSRGDAIIRALAADPKLVVLADPTTRIRLNSLLVSVVRATADTVGVTTMRHPIKLLEGMAATLEEAELFPIFEPLANQVITKYWKNPELVKAAAKSQGLMERLFRKFLDLGGSTQFEEANSFAKVLPDLDQPIASAYDGSHVLRLLAAVCSAAETGAWSARALRSERFASVPRLREKAIKVIDARPRSSEEIVKESGLTCSAATFKQKYLLPPPQETE